MVRRPDEALYLALLGALACERLFELWLSARNARRQLARGALEVGRGHFPLMAALHACFLVSCAAELLVFHPRPPLALAIGCLLVAGGAQVLRYWAVSTLGERWNTRVIVHPDDAPVTTGPYRFVRHPNYVAVVLELLAIPLLHGCWRTALIFTLGNAAVLAIRIPAEERALGGRYAVAFGDRPRFLPLARSRRHG